MSTLNELAGYLAETEISAEAAKIILDIAALDLSRAAALRDAIGSPKDESQVGTLTLPTIAPALWSDKAARGRRDPHQFVKYYYRDWLGSGFARVHLRALDLPLYYAYAMWENRQPPDAERLPRQSAALGITAMRPTP
jgi:hypothetical protein